MKKSIISVLGKDSVGIIATICTYLADNNVNILDISQTIVDGLFQMMMVCDTDKCSKEFHEVSQDLNKIGEDLGIQIKLQKSEIFLKMQRI
ncbi:MAG: ACT domain-containing protein [Pleomorphochaeta sp.]